MCLSYYLTFKCVVPTTMLPSQAEYVFWLWSSFFIVLFMGTYCSLCHATSKPQDISSRNLPKKQLHTFILFALFSFSHILQTLLPQVVAAFSRRVLVFVALLAFHLVVGQVAGLAVIRVWTHPISAKKI